MIRFVVALPAEARPLIRRFGLKRSVGGEFPVWRGASASLVISGVGRAPAFAAVTGLAAEEPAAQGIWLNVGIGGHRSLPLGEVVLAREVVDASGGCTWPRPRLFEPPCAISTVTTVARPETAYPEETVYEMEAAGFCQAASRFTSAERIQVVKVISDNVAAPPGRLTARRVEELIEGRVETIAEVVERAFGALHRRVT